MLPFGEQNIQHLLFPKKLHFKGAHSIHKQRPFPIVADFINDSEPNQPTSNILVLSLLEPQEYLLKYHYALKALWGYTSNCLNKTLVN